jgi:hypothetical protein
MIAARQHTRQRRNPAMSIDVEPVIDAWYAHLDKGQKFKVVAIDEARRSVEVQHFDGDVEEIDLDTWPDLDVTPIDEPEDWTGPYDAVEDDAGNSGIDARPAPWSSDYADIHPHGIDEEPDPANGDEDAPPGG